LKNLERENSLWGGGFAISTDRCWTGSDWRRPQVDALRRPSIRAGGARARAPYVVAGLVRNCRAPARSDGCHHVRCRPDRSLLRSDRVDYRLRQRGQLLDGDPITSVTAPDAVTGLPVGPFPVLAQACVPIDTAPVQRRRRPLAVCLEFACLRVPQKRVAVVDQQPTHRVRSVRIPVLDWHENAAPRALGSSHPAGRN
jgi:hypothetical protein